MLTACCGLAVLVVAMAPGLSLADDCTYRDIAAKLVIGEETVRTHVKNILRKLGQPDRVRAVRADHREHLL